MKMIFLGPPGAGKGTIAAKTKERYAIPHISTGDLFRENVGNQTELGQKVKAIMDRGDLVPDELTVAMVKDRLNQSDASGGFILDGFPRTIPQAEALAGIASIDHVVNFVVPETALIRRLTGRRMCKNCGRSYHVDYVRPVVEGICDHCGGELYIRDDDTPEAVGNRLRVYQESTEPLIRWYEEKNLLRNIDGNVAPEDVQKRVEEAISNR